MNSAISSGRFEHIRLTKLGCEILHNDASRQHGIAKAIWSTMPTLGQTDHLVAAAMAAFGASAETYSFPNSQNMTVYARYYANALHLIKESISDPKSSSLVLMLGCLLLASSEVVMGQEWPALYHLQGTLQVLQRRQLFKSQNGTIEEQPDGDSQFALQDDLDYAGAIVDLGVATYALGRNPRLPRLTNSQKQPVLNQGDQSSLNELRVVQTLHTSYAFASNHFHWRYAPQRFTPSEAFVTQNQICAELFQRIQEITQTISAKELPHLTRAHILRAQCSACLVYLQNLFEPRETSYDRFLASFKSIVEDAEIVLHNIPDQSRVHFKFSLDLGVVQPLFFTTIKCRDLRTRLRAISLLRKTGREGAFDGQRVAVVARRAVELEIGYLDTLEQNPETRHTSSVPERMRLHGANSAMPDSLEAMATDVLAYFSRCNDVEDMMQATTAEEYKEERHWENWDEYLPFPTERKLGLL